MFVQCNVCETEWDDEVDGDWALDFSESMKFYCDNCFDKEFRCACGTFIETDELRCEYCLAKEDL